MKKYFVLGCVMLFVFTGISIESSAKTNELSVVSVKKDRFGKKRKDGSFKRKRSGFLGLWGKRKSCDCPN